MRSCDLEGRLTSSHAVPVPSLYDTFGISYGGHSSNPRTGARGMMPRHSDALDSDMHAGHRQYVHYGPSRPLYGRPDEWELNDYVYMSSTDRLMSSESHNHRGRVIGGMESESTNHGYRGARRSIAVDDGSIRYPRRMSFGSTSGRSRVDDGSGRSFAI